jgi:hypothetical protein
MMSIIRRLSVSVLALAVVGVVSACGGTSTSTSSGSSSQTPLAGSSTSAGSQPSGGDAQGFCAVVRQQRAVLQGTELSGLLVGGSTDAWKAYLAKVTAMNQQLVDTAPDQIQADVKTLQSGTLELKSTLEAANYDVTKVGSARLVQLLQTPQRRDATAAIVAYVKTQCGIDLTKLEG